ncbi:MAG: hypothetical protein CVU56_28565 [Deltaproteobacteria bacterium HGW-Deltaproteobacteria-14]|jgi:flagellar hook-associated protein 3 FlgL|nr:MAG: hypothetical protein CVU56_28565 [Deltaproteobacteria bacterium HGW-Deltaproteobacteria-14]
MRITQQLVANLVRQRNESATARYYDVTSRISASSAVERPSQDPVRAARINNIERFTHDLDMLDNNRRTIKSDLNMAENLVASMQDLLVDAKALALSMSSDNNSEADRKNGAIAAQHLIDQFIGLANQRQSSGKYLFTGLSETTPPIDPATGTYRGDNMSRLVEIGPGVSIEATMAGADIFGPGEEVLTSMRALVTALATNDTDGIQATFDRLDDAHEILTLGRTEIGGRLATIEDIDSLSLDLRTTASMEHADLTAVDLSALAPQLSSAQNMLTAVVETTRNLMQQAASSWLR